MSDHHQLRQLGATIFQTNDHGVCRCLQGASHVAEVCSLRKQKVGLEQEVGQLKAELQTQANLVCQDYFMWFLKIN